MRKVKIAKADCVEALETEINMLLVQGYEPQGVITPIVQGGKSFLVMPMIKYFRAEKDPSA